MTLKITKFTKLFFPSSQEYRAPFPLIRTELVRAAATAHAHEKVQQWLEKNNNIHWNKRVELMAVRDDPRFY